MPSYNPSNWYWVVAGSTMQVWSSARVKYVPTTDATYVAWLAAGNRPTQIASANDLFGVLAKQWTPVAQASGVQVTSTATASLNGTYAVDAASQATISSLSTGIAAGKPLPGGGTTFNYPDVSNTMHAFTSANFLDFSASIEGFVYSFEQGLLGLLNGVAGAALPSTSLTIA
jgi:hypothetical protein